MRIITLARWRAAFLHWLHSDERQSCPDRGVGPFKREPGLDYWERGRWKDEPLDMVRTCSFCGSVHPEDVLGLLARGWDHEKAKHYKGYLYPPGYLEAVRALVTGGGGYFGDGTVPQGLIMKQPSPPAKFYTIHFSDDQLARLNAALVARNGTE
mgnify:CR=1 FL=1